MNVKPASSMPTSATMANAGGISASRFVLLIAIANILFYHYPLAEFSAANIDYVSVDGLRTLSTLIVIVFVVTFVLLSVLTLFSAFVLKTFCVIAAVGNALALYFISTYHVILDKSMMGNIFNTRAIESTEFFHPKLLAYLFFLGLLPAWLVWRVRLRSPKRIQLLLHIGFVLVFGLSFIYINGSTALWLDKHSRKLGGVILPWSYMINSARVQLDYTRQNVQQTLLPAVTSITNHKTVVALVIGETARANNFSVYGYERTTNPLIAASGAIVLPGATACSTYTTASIHCMLSHDGSSSGADEPLPSYLQRHSVDVMWRSNNWGEPAIDVAEYIDSSDLKKNCTGTGCDYDEVLLTDLVERIHSSKSKKIFVVLHTKGSHGPSYHARYPQSFNVFAPVCKSVELGKCSRTSLVNAYDNTILYTDYFLKQTILRLSSLANTPTLMMYVSDHGESLGEYGLYLHGTPNAIAPDVQKNIPFIIWMSESFKLLMDIDETRFTQPGYAHNNVFHSVLGAFGIQSPVYRPNLDIFRR